MAVSKIVKQYTVSDYEMGTSSSGSNGFGSVSFAKSHTTAPDVVLVTGWSQSNDAVRIAGVTTKSESGFSFYTSTGSGIAQSSIFWVAIWK